MEKEIKVLVVDDEADFAQPMAFWLKSKGYSVLAASSGEAGIKLIKENNPDIVFLDLTMPVMDGAETLKRVREFNKDLPIIIISAHVDDPRMAGIRPYVISGVFYKGKEFSELAPLLEVALKTHKKLQK